MTIVRDHDVEELGKCKGTVTMRDIVFISYFPGSVGLAKKNKSVLRMRTLGKAFNICFR